MCIASIEEALEDIKAGKMVIVVDEEDRENEGDLTMAAEKVTPEAVNFMATYGRGLICMPMTGKRLDELQIPSMVSQNESVHGTAFCVSIEAKRNVSTGISAADRATTILTAVSPDTKPDDLVRPGHVFPLRAREGGVLERAGQTEAAVDLARLAGLQPAGVICEIMNPDGTMARMDDLKRFAAQHGLKIITVVDLIRYRLQNERFVHLAEQHQVETEFGGFQLLIYRNALDGRRHVALVKGTLRGEDPVLLRVHTQAPLADALGVRGVAGAGELRTALKRIAKEGRGVIVYLLAADPQVPLQQELEDLQERNGGRHRDVPNFKEYGVGAQILVDLGLHRVRLFTNHPKKLSALEGFGIEIVEQIPLENPAADRFLESLTST
ncbi:MAG TPA: 3,4-dihydroxy-2-butanone-4-phosphate synthase [Acidobacteriota bacterium]|nr:3,4-dihydroxy-2-butanone-4-phosphate synthase [Acidobacteriota bacterium]